MEETTKKESREKRKFLEVDEEMAKKVQIFCFLKEITIKKFVTETIKKELMPYESWLENVKKLKLGQEYSKDNC